MAFMSISVLPAFLEDKVIMIKERANGCCKCYYACVYLHTRTYSRGAGQFLTFETLYIELMRIFSKMRMQYIQTAPSRIRWLQCWWQCPSFSSFQFAWDLSATAVYS
jgi:hypothetical protein